jgi:DNA repair protein RadC
MAIESKKIALPDIETQRLGHRDRLRERFIKNGAAALQDYELLELILFMAIPRRDVKPLAKGLIAHFGNLPAVFNAPIDQLAQFKGLTETSAIALKIIQTASTVLVRSDITDRPILSSWQRLLDYCHATMAHEKNEQFRLLLLNKKNELIADEVQHTGTVDHTPAYPREIVKRALELHATAMILVHNHPSGDPKPSKDDIELTRTVIDAARPFDIVVHDHLIVARKSIFSFRNKGLI